MTVFDVDTTPAPDGEGHFTVTFNRNWWVINGPNGGLVAAVVLRAAEAALADPRRFARTLTVHYLTPPREGPARCVATVLRAGRTTSFVSVSLLQDRRPCATALVALAADRPPEADVGFALANERPPPVPPPDACPRLVLEGAEPSQPALRDRWESRWVFGALPGAEGAAAHDELEAGGWIRLAEPRALDAAVLAAMADAWVPPALTRPQPVRFAVPTVELTVHFRSRRALQSLAPDDWCLARFRCRTAQEGLVEEDGLIWSPDGVLLAQSRQLALVQPLPPDAPPPPLLRLERPA
jgi:acyl-CoA thioesterase